jgi:hypothetical protein
VKITINKENQAYPLTFNDIIHNDGMYEYNDGSIALIINKHAFWIGSFKNASCSSVTPHEFTSREGNKFRRISGTIEFN